MAVIVLSRPNLISHKEAELSPLMMDRAGRKGLKSSKITYYLSWVKFNKELPACVNQ